LDPLTPEEEEALQVQREEEAWQREKEEQRALRAKTNEMKRARRRRGVAWEEKKAEGPRSPAVAVARQEAAQKAHALRVKARESEVQAALARVQALESEEAEADARLFTDLFTEGDLQRLEEGVRASNHLKLQKEALQAKRTADATALEELMHGVQLQEQEYRDMRAKLENTARS
jgi:transposase InsO family protein